MFWEWLQYRRKAKDRHGIHSPLVYALVDTVLLQPDGSPVKERIRNHFKDWQWNEFSCEELPQTPQLLSTSSRTILFVNAPHRNKVSADIWLHAAVDPSVTIAIDCWDFGLLLATPDVKEQQYFTLKYRP